MPRLCRGRYGGAVRSTRHDWLVAGLGVVAALGLLLPWARTGDRTRSSIDLLSSTTALDLLESWQRLVLLTGWFVVVAVAALGLVLVAWDRPRAGLAATALVGPGLLAALLALGSSPLAIAWGAWLASGLGATASIGSGLVVLTHVSARKGSRA